MGGISYVISKKRALDRGELSPFECGFLPIKVNRISFSIQFFLVSLIFLIFDIELVLLFPLIRGLVGGLRVFRVIGVVFFFIILVVGVLFEWNIRKLEWEI